MARKQHKEQGFGSDSFLDVLANMVGILIILIVIVGMRVSRAPVFVPEATVEVLPAVPTVLDDPVELGPPQTLVWAVESPPLPLPPVKSKPLIPAPVAPLAPPQDLVDASTAVQTDLTALRAHSTETEEEAQSLARRVGQQEQSLAQTRRQLAAASIDHEAIAKTARLTEDERAKLQSDLVALETALREACQQAPQVKILKHTLTPVSQLVRGPELHFRLSGNRVSHVPIDTLVERLQAQIQRQREFLLSQEYYESSVGPLDGYRMEFVLERAPPTAVEELNYGVRMVKLEVTSWSIKPEQGMFEETTEQALRRGSHFLNTMETAGVGATLTFWVYPDSFELHRALQDYAQTQGWRVAARPLPDGVPIAGSPRGSKSLSQ
ncbi:MAG: hypothetical protein DWH91_15075 [Planctomycetota bacterium]|nr:MAG: hypothetical protein DWH91_15075 [Planctomycetota bacterium]